MSISNAMSNLMGAKIVPWGRLFHGEISLWLEDFYLFNHIGETTKQVK